MTGALRSILLPAIGPAVAQLPATSQTTRLSVLALAVSMPAATDVTSENEASAGFASPLPAVARRAGERDVVGSATRHRAPAQRRSGRRGVDVVARVADAVVVGVSLIRVGRQRTVVEAIRHAVRVRSSGGLLPFVPASTHRWIGSRQIGEEVVAGQGLDRIDGRQVVLPRIVPDALGVGHDHGDRSRRAADARQVVAAVLRAAPAPPSRSRPAR